MALVRKMDLGMIIIVMVAAVLVFLVLIFANQVIIIRLLKKKKPILADECTETGFAGENGATQTSTTAMMKSPSLVSSVPSLFEIMKRSAKFGFKTASQSASLIYSGRGRSTSSETILRRISLVM